MITLQFVAAADIGSRAIRWFGGGAFSHVDAVLEDQYGRQTLLGARSDRVWNCAWYDPPSIVTTRLPAGVVERPPFYAKWVRRVTAEIIATEEQEALFRRFLSLQLCKPYDTTAIWAFVLGRNWRERDSWFCSELQAAALEHAKVLAVCPAMKLNKITPTDLALMVGALPNVTWKEHSC